MRLILLGPAGSGKGTQARFIEEKYHIPQLSSGDIFRQNIQERTSLGLRVEEIINAGDLVPDEILIGMIEEQLKSPTTENGFILDGFIRTLAQAEALDKMLSKHDLALDAVIRLRVDEEKLIHRLTGRYICTNCGEGYHDELKQPRVPGVCDVCKNKEFTRRDDDTVEGIKKRLALFEEQTRPIIPYYESSGRLHRIDGSQDIEKVWEEIDGILSGIGC